ncbi:MAG: right-handed parallel beta-helix repeat-containing protein, partial [bacterium]|nr:right-handed parallel beta-helix repeat-containing protein [bacterium]
MIATTTITLAWSSPDSDLDHYILECMSGITPCTNFSFASTTATSTIYTATNTASYIFKAKAIDTSGNESNQKAISPEVSLHPIVINEIAWAGTGGSPATNKDEWVELYNTTGKKVSLSGIILNSPSNPSFNINLSGTIDPHGFYLIERTNDTVITDITADLIASFGDDLSNDGEQLFLVLGSTTIDKTPPLGVCPTWCKGTGASDYKTMERYDPLLSGEDYTNWSTWSDIAAFGANAEGNPIKGTPKHRNSAHYFILNSSSDFTTPKTLTKANSPYVSISQSGINATLTIEPGVVIKFKGASAGLYGHGQILAQGTEQDPVVFTSFEDDSYGGDSNQNGTSTLPKAGDWGSITLPTNGSVIDHAIIRYGGGDSNATQVNVVNASVDITNSIIEESPYFGISLDNARGTVTSNTIRKNGVQNGRGMSIVGGNLMIRANTFTQNYVGLFLVSGSSAYDLAVEDNTFTDNGLNAIRADTVNPRLSGNTATGNGNNGIVLIGSMTHDYTITPDLPYVLETSYQVNQGKTLTIAPGVIVKFQTSGTLMISGSLQAQGTSDRPIVFTSIHDDDCGLSLGCGDTNGTTTAPMAGDWSTLWFDAASGSSTVAYTTIRYGGFGDMGGIHINSPSVVEIRHSTIEKNSRIGVVVDHSSPVISDSIIQDASLFGMYLISSSTPTISNTHFKNNATHIFPDTTSSYTDGGGNV